jgi:hypothetical protein
MFGVAIGSSKVSSITNDQAALHAMLTDALSRADSLDLTMVAIHIDEARALIAQLPGVALLLDEALPAHP